MQLSFQDSTREMNDFLSHTRTFELKNRVAQIIKEHGWPMVLNVVMHRMNIDHIDRIIGMAQEMGAEYLELANTQYYSWAFLNRDAAAAHARAAAARRGRHRRLARAPRRRDAALLRRARLPRGQGEEVRQRLGQHVPTVAPDGTALPCHTAKMLPGLAFPNVREQSLREIWFDSEGFNRYRGTGWMKEPCASCDARRKTSAAAAARPI